MSRCCSTFGTIVPAVNPQVGENQTRLGYASLATTGRYLAALHRAENTHGEDLARMFAMEE
jgi:hypothetical protein